LPGRNQKMLWKLLKMFLVIGIILYVINVNGGLRMLEEMSQAKVSWILLSGVCFLLSIVVGSGQWYFLSILQNLKVRFYDCFKIYYMGMFLNAIMFNLAGDALRVYKIRSDENLLTTGIVSTFMDRFLGLSVLSFFSVIAVIFIWNQALLPQKQVEVLFLLSFIIFCSFLTGAAALSSRRFGRLFQLFFRLLRLKRVENFYDSVKDCMFIYRSKWKAVLLISLISVTIHSLRIFGYYFCSVALGLDIHLAYFYCFIPIISLVTLIPLNIGGWGLPQGMSTKLFGLPGVISGIDSTVLSVESVRIAAGSLTFLPSIIFYIIMLAGGLFFISDGKFKHKT